MSDAFDEFNSEDSRSLVRAALTNANMQARASVVNRTHRVVRERAKTMAARRSQVRSLWIPMAVCSSLLVIICTAVWSVLDQYEVTPNGVPDASNQFLVLCLWFLPVSMALLAVVLFQRARKREAAR
jgi:protein-S-isoprenylcysteine O-methyltransferase Ste14